MEKRLNTRIEKYIREFKGNIALKTEQVGLAGNEQAGQLMQYIFDYDRLILDKDDFIKRKRVKNVVPFLERCCAKRARLPDRQWLPRQRDRDVARDSYGGRRHRCGGKCDARPRPRRPLVAHRLMPRLVRR